MKSDSSSGTKRPRDDAESQLSDPAAGPRQKRPKTSKACNACRKQKSRCERLAGDSEGCHRCGVIGISCVFESDGLSVDSAKFWKPRPILPRNRGGNEHRLPQISPDNSGLHVLANTTELLARAGRVPTTVVSSKASSTTSSSRATVQHIRQAPTPKMPLSPETLSTVESALFPLPRDDTSESELARFRADWRRWVAPLALLQTLVRRDNATSSPLNGNLPLDSTVLTPIEEKRLKDHFRFHYTPWLPDVRLGKSGTLDDVSPFLTTVIYATAARTSGAISQRSIRQLRALSLHHVGQVFASPSVYPLVDSLYALLILILWPLDAADDVALLVHGAKRLASSGDRGPSRIPNDVSHLNYCSQRDNGNRDHVRLWYAICANESILTLGAGRVTSSPPVDDLVQAFGSASDLALSGGSTADILIVLQTNLHRIVTAAIGERGITSDRNVPSIPKDRESLLNYISTVHMFLTKLGEWEIEFYTISGECDPSEAAHYAVLEIEYHYVCLIFTTHCLLIVCHACPLESASDETKAALWSWSITGIKHAHALIRLFNAYSVVRADAHRDDEDKAPLPPLALAPDRIFAMVVLGVMLILRHQVASHEYGRRRGLAESPPAGFTRQAEVTIRRAIERMGNIGHIKAMETPQASTSDHAASRYVDILEALFRIWKEKRAQKVSSVAAPEGYTDLECGIQQGKKGADGSNVHHSQAPLQPGPAMQPDLDLSLLESDLFCDTAAAFTWDGLGTLDWQGAGQ